MSGRSDEEKQSQEKAKQSRPGTGRAREAKDWSRLDLQEEAECVVRCVCGGVAEAVSHLDEVESKVV